MSQLHKFLHCLNGFQFPRYIDTVLATTREKDYLACSIVNCIFGDLILGIIAIVFSVMAREHFDTGKLENNFKLIDQPQIR